MAAQVTDAVDATLEELLLRRVTGLGPNATGPQISFHPPESNWALNLATPPGLNVYLVDLRENRRLRSNARDSRPVNGQIVDEPAPMRLDRHYLVSAWSNDSDVSDRARAEHQLLAEVVAVMANTPVLVPRRVYTPGGLPQGFPLTLADEPLPVTVVPPDGFPKLAEFWGTMPGRTHPWKPVVYLVVTVPVFLDTTFAGAEVTTLTTEYQVNGNPNGAEILVRIGGVVRDRRANPIDVRNVWVELSDNTGLRLDTTRTNAQGEFSFGDLVPGTYGLRARAPGLPSHPPQSVVVPSPAGRYDLEFP